ncbi:hypothetical protein BKA64DRAFT_329895 [Cadophora sp. MPI-SDFR-AT-0126]|nr:hypothetical protein BKA64DRAFT_329895 [Leotiomycetes sp. MPI-SDFR-AT-0126]
MPPSCRDDQPASQRCSGGPSVRQICSSHLDPLNFSILFVRRLPCPCRASAGSREVQSSRFQGLSGLTSSGKFGRGASRKDPRLPLPPLLQRHGPTTHLGHLGPMQLIVSTLSLALLSLPLLHLESLMSRLPARLPRFYSSPPSPPSPPLTTCPIIISSSMWCQERCPRQGIRVHGMREFAVHRYDAMHIWGPGMNETRCVPVLPSSRAEQQHHNHTTTTCHNRGTALPHMPIRSHIPFPRSASTTQPNPIISWRKVSVCLVHSDPVAQLIPSNPVTRVQDRKKINRP